MAAVSVSFDGTRLNDAEALGSVWTDTGGKSASLEPDIVFQNTYSVSEKVGTTALGVAYKHTSGIDFSSPVKIALFKVTVTNPAALLTTLGQAMNLWVGSELTAADYWVYYIYTSTTFPALGGWQIIPIDPNLVAFRDATVGTPGITGTDVFAVHCDFSAASKSENVAMDAIDYIGVGEGLTLYGGTSTDPDAIFQDFVDYDFGTKNNRWGIVTQIEGVIYVTGTLNIGDGTNAVVFTDSFGTIIFKGGRVPEGFAGINLDLSVSGSVVNISSYTFVGKGQSSVKKWFDPNSQVNGTTEVFTVPGHGYVTGDYVQYNDEGFSTITGLTDLSYYWVYVIDSDTFALHATRASALADTTRVGVTANATTDTEAHSFTREPDNRPKWVVTGNTGNMVVSGCLFDNFLEIEIDGGAVGLLRQSTIINTHKVIVNDTLTDTAISNQTTGEGEALITTGTLSSITGCTIGTANQGHFIELTGTTKTQSWNNVCSGWTPAAGGWNFLTSAISSNVITMNATHDFETGDAVWYNDEGGVVTLGITDGNRYYVRVISTTTVQLHHSSDAAVNNVDVVSLTASGSETHSLYSDKATIYNNQGGSLVTINVATGAVAPSIRNGTGSSTTVVDSVALTVTCKNTSGLAIPGVKVRIETTAGVLIAEGTTNASGIFTDNYGGTKPVAVNVIARLKGFKNQEASDTITTNGLSVPFTMPRDGAVYLP